MNENGNGYDYVRNAAETPVPWDDVRQQRVLSRIEAARAAKGSVGTSKRWIAAAVSGGLVAAAAVLLFVLGPLRVAEEPAAIGSVGAELGETLVIPSIRSIPFAAPSQLRLPDNSVAQLRHGAQVDVEIQSPTEVRLQQHSGEVRYEVAPDRNRSFVVDAAGVEVRVVGTIFTVTLASTTSADEDIADRGPSRVTVMVERGLVEVDNGSRVAELGPGDSLSVEATPSAGTIATATAPAHATTPSPTTAPRPTIDALLRDADEARGRGDLRRAAHALRELVRRHPHDPRAYSALFQLGKVERARGHHGAAANAFAKCWKRSPQGPLAEDARAEAAVSFDAAGRRDQARAAAEQYLARYPRGTHRARLSQLLAPQ